MEYYLVWEPGTYYSDSERVGRVRGRDWIRGLVIGLLVSGRDGGIRVCKGSPELVKGSRRSKDQVW